MRYISTRGGTPPVGFQDAVLMGLAPDGGLILPETIPRVADRLASWRRMSYSDLAIEIFLLFSDLSRDDLRHLVARSYASFTAPDVVNIVRAGPMHVLELFHGPTLAFKDIALQFMGNLFDTILDRRDQHLNIVVATSGDTGSAAIHGIRGRRRMKIFVIHPHGKISRTQERQMTTVLDENVSNVAIEGTFDDCQRILKELFSDLELKARAHLGAVNSINWGRLLAQIVYYFYAAFRVMEQSGAGQIRFAVPTGNFGDIFAGYLAAQMGLPVGSLVLATNDNDVLCRFFQTGIYRPAPARSTISPSMDIQVASNFERYVYYRVGENGREVASLMQNLLVTGRVEIPRLTDGRTDALFVAGSATIQDTLKAIRKYWKESGYLMDPHTAVGAFVAEQYSHPDEPTILLATAHPAKFGQAIQDAVGQDVAHHPSLDGLEDLPARCDVLPASVDALRMYIMARI